METIDRFVEEHDREPEPFVWTADPVRIAETARRMYHGLASLERLAGSLTVPAKASAPGPLSGRAAITAARVEWRLTTDFADVNGYSFLMERVR